MLIKLGGLDHSIRIWPIPSGGIETRRNCGSTGCLYNIIEDPEERVDLAEIEPETLKTMQEKLAEYQVTYFNPDRGQVWPGACETVLNTYEWFWGPFLPWLSYNNIRCLTTIKTMMTVCLIVALILWFHKNTDK